MNVLSILANAVLAVGSQTTIPSVYHGEWSEILEACGDENTVGVLIEPGRITFYEARGEVLHASEGAKGASARVKFTGEGKSWEETVRFNPLNVDRLELTALGDTHIFHRCPDGGND